jgi:hypothetical protein
MDKITRGATILPLFWISKLSLSEGIPYCSFIAELHAISVNPLELACKQMPERMGIGLFADTALTTYCNAVDKDF